MGIMHHLDVGCADASVIKITDGTFLIDCHNIGDYAFHLPSNKRLRGVFITHQHSDHYSGLAYLRRNGYSIDCLIYSPYERRYGDNSVTADEWNEFNSHRDYFKSKGTKLFRPFRQESFEDPYWRAGEVQFWMLGPIRHIAQSSTRELHDACLVIKAHLGSNRTCLFTGDASDTLVEAIATSGTHICGDILHASHHGSIEGADLTFVKACKARYTVISTRAGVYQHVPHATALSRYRDNTSDKVYRTDQDHSLKWAF